MDHVSGGMSLTPNQIEAVTNHLAQFLRPERVAQMHQVLMNRTNHLVVILEDIYQSQNASAAVRTCECFGIQQIHIVEETSQYETNLRVLRGSSKWVHLHRYHDKTRNNIEWCLNKIEQEGYQLCIADPGEDGIDIHDLDVMKPLALLFGNEHRGVSEYAWSRAAIKLKIPMVGFTESLNISASVAISLDVTLNRIRNSGIDWKLPETYRASLMLEWLRKSVRGSDVIEREFLRSNS